jgi:septum formation protein
MTAPYLILASTSATRRALLESSGVSFVSQSPDCDEEKEKQNYRGDPAQGLALHLAKVKALSISSSKPEALVLGADQTLIFEDQVFSKATDLEDAHHMLQKMRGKTHVLQSALAVAQGHHIVWTEVQEARLYMRGFSDEFLNDYLARQPSSILSSVGCYQIEKQGIQLFDRIDGEHATILGLPLLGLLRFLREKGMLAT